MRAELVLLLDTDVLWLCSAAEVIEKRVKTLAQMELAAARTVILFGEKGMWPPYQEFHGVQLRSNETAGYPPATAREPFRFVNAGAALGRPRDVLAMLECMQARYEGFPDACPAGHGPDGELRYNSPNRSYVPPRLVVPSRLTKYYHGIIMGCGCTGATGGGSRDASTCTTSSTSMPSSRPRALRSCSTARQDGSLTWQV